MLRELTGEDETDRSLNLARRDSGAVVVRRELGGLGSDTLEDVRDERVEDGHGLVAAMSVHDPTMDKVQSVLTRYQCRGGPA